MLMNTGFQGDSSPPPIHTQTHTKSAIFTHKSGTQTALAWIDVNLDRAERAMLQGMAASAGHTPTVAENYAELAKALGVARRTLQNWRKRKDAPKPAANGFHEVAAWHEFMQRHGLRRATLRGCEKLTKRHMVAAMTYNLSLLMRSLFGIGTPKQAMAASQARLIAACRWLSRLVRHLFSRIAGFCLVIRACLRSSPAICRGPGFARFSTGC